MDASAVDIYRLGLPPEADIWVLPGEGLLTRFPDGLHAFPGSLAIDCARYLHSAPATADELFFHLCQTHPPVTLVSALTDLREGGLICENEADQASVPDPALGFTERIERAEFSLWGSNQRPSDEAMFVVSTPLSALSGLSLPATPWCPVHIDTEGVAVGPLFNGFATDPCLDCLSHIATEHDDLGRFLDAHPSAYSLQTARLPENEQSADMQFLADALQRLPQLPAGAILLRKRSDGSTTQARARARGGCPVCNTPAAGLGPDLPMLASIREGGYRPIAARDLLPDLEQFVDPVSGIVRDLRPLPTSPQAKMLNQTVRARHAFPLSSPDLAATIGNRQGRSAGKGRDSNSTRVGAIAEAMERYAGLARAQDVHATCPAEALDGPVILPEAWMLYSSAQQADHMKWQALGAASARVPPPRRAEDVIEWSRIEALTGEDAGRFGWAPAALCWHQFRPDEGCAVVGWADSNGCAAGQKMTDARLQGLLELVERDAVGIWWWSRANLPEIAVSMLRDPWADEVEQVLAGLGYDLSFRDLTHDLGVPVAAAVAWPIGDIGPVLMGFGAHPSRDVALSRSLTELLQALPDQLAQMIGGNPWDGLPLLPEASAPTGDDFTFLRPGAGAAATAFAPLAPPPSPDAETALRQLTGALDARGLQVWCLDQSRPDVPLRVVRMIVPGLRHFRPRFAPGRLDTVPDALGWRRLSTSENPCFIP
ncbi:YcaO-like family protein [Primorskyibacter sp. S87]|uniref:YcaO-like family protein n=1 Tax=Primorskyibacter sp. S87 TaxID=3415126 RepID=UPI003C79AC76